MIYSVISEKGGCSKTTTAEALIAGLQRRGFSVLAIDADPQCNLTTAMRSDREIPTLYDVLQGDSTAADAIRHTERGDVIPGDRHLYSYTGSTDALRDALEPIKKKFDYTVIDCPPSMGILSLNAIIAADAAIIPTQAELYSLQALVAIRETISTAHPDLWISGILVTRYAGRTVAHRELSKEINAVAGELGTTPFNTRIRECSAIRTAQATQQDIFCAAPRSNAAKDYDAFIDEVLYREEKTKRRKRRV